VTYCLKLLVKPFALARAIMRQKQHPFPLVDALKGTSVLMVILFHVCEGVVLIYDDNTDGLQAFVESLPPFVNLAFAFDNAVDIFFLLSSFLLSTGLFKAAGEGHGINIPRFYLHRFFRLYPLLLVALVLYGLPQLNNLLTHGWCTLLFIDNILGKTIIPVGWSLDVEVQFYVLLPFIILFVRRRRRPAVWLAGLALGSVLLRAWVVLRHPFTYQTPWVAFLANGTADTYLNALGYQLQTRGTPLVLGILWAHVVRTTPAGSLKLPRWAFRIAIACLAASAYFALLFPVCDAGSWYYAHFDESVNFLLVTGHRAVFSITVLLGVLLFHLCGPPSSGSLIDRVVGWRFWRLLSEVAYPMYLFHLPMVIIAWLLALGTVNPTEVSVVKPSSIPIVFLLATAMTLYLSLWLNQLIEAPWIRRGKRIEHWLFATNGGSSRPHGENDPRTGPQPDHTNS